MASTVSAGMAFAMLVIMMVTVRFTACIKSSCDKCVYSSVCASTCACIKLDSGFLKSSLCSSADSAADKCVNLGD
jgi:hypothetical protein